LALTLEVTLYDKDGQPIDDRLFGAITAAKSWADEKGAVAIEAFDAESEETTFYMKGGIKENWYETSEKLFKRRMERYKERSQ
jgi:sugar (pentulose or hexulose) kinase